MLKNKSVNYLRLKYWIFPLSIGITLCVLSVIMWQSLKAQEDANLNVRIENEARNLLDTIQTDLKTRIQSLQRVVLQWELRGNIPKKEFDSLITSIHSNSSGFQAIEWVDKNYTVQWVVPLVGNENALGLNLAFENDRRLALKKAQTSLKPTITRPVTLVQGGQGVLIYLPIFSNNEFEGFILAVLKTQDWITSTLAEDMKNPTDFHAMIFIDNKEVYSNNTQLAPSERHNLYTLNSDSFEKTFSVQINPTTSFIKNNTTRLPMFVLMAGIFLSLLISVVIHLFQRALILSQIASDGEKALQKMVHFDVLTKLPNRVLFADRFYQAVAHSTRTENMLAVCFLDLDDFKPVNDNHGHDVGDKLLIEVASRIKECIREEDTVSRQGGDEFTLLLRDIESFKQCKETLDRVRDALAQPCIINDYPHKVTASIGTTIYPLDEADLDTLIRHADQAMYQAKLAGKNQLKLFNSLNDHEITNRQSQLSEVKQALTGGQFQLYYQPKVNMKTGKVFGVEALIRWIHPEKGLIPPLDFLPLIDGTELEIQVGGWVINEALQQLDDWQQQGIKLEVSINISSHHLQSEAFFDQLNEALDKHPDVNSQDLQLEILESSALGDINAISGIIKSCQNVLGVNVALDDFGTGYSSLTHMKNLSANTIKIDQTFVRDLLDDPNDYSIIEGVIGLAAQSGKLQSCTDCRNNEQFKVSEQDLMPGSIVSVPVMALGELFGVLNVSHPDAHYFSDWHRRLLEIYKNMLGQLISNFRLFKQMEQQIALKTEHLQHALEEATLLQQRYENLSMIDSLTGLYNRRFFYIQVTKALAASNRYGGELCLLLLDLDCFKAINDNYGHGFGDQVLVDVSAALKRQMRESDIVARFGGEEFVVLFKKTDCAKGAIFAERIRKEIAALQWTFNQQTVSISTSIGMHCLGESAALEGDVLMDDFIHYADLAMYQAKNNGKNQVVVFTDTLLQAKDG